MNSEEARHRLVKKLLNDFHLNINERKIFESFPLSIREIQEVINSELNSKRIFPIKAYKEKGEQVYEGFYIEKLDDSQYKLHSQRHYATNPLLIVEKNEEIFESLNKITKEYLKREFKYNIDGIIIKED